MYLVTQSNNEPTPGEDLGEGSFQTFTKHISRTNLLDGNPFLP
jgi:hypothetical protein